MATHDNSPVDAVPPAARPQAGEFLDDILRSTPFRTSRQCQDLFRYIVEHSLAGSDESLRERVIGIEVFGRAPDYDTAQDPVVRVRAADVRKRLAKYYQTQKNSTGQWKIEIPTGSYKAQFHRPEGAVSQVATATDVTHPSEAIASQHPERLIGNTRFRKINVLWATGGVILLVAIFAGLMLTRHTTIPTGNALDLFWGPALENPRPVFVCTGSNSVYVLSSKAIEKYRTAHPHPQDATTNLEAVVPPEELRSLSGDDFIPVKDRFLTTGDASATAQISSLLTSRHHPFDLRFGTDLSFGDLRNSSAVLVGAFNNSWTLNMTDNLRFVYESGDSPQMHVRDRFDASRSWWPKFLGEKDSDDYAIVSRILDSKTGSSLIIIAGLTHRGTQAAGDFITNPELVAEFIKQAPKDWSRKNLQIVLHTNVVNDIPGSPTVVASYYW
jgi:hypothetical protein